jgi:SPP1 family predicted phage head-tail adaptor
MKCGEFRAKASHFITIQERSTTSGDYGGVSVTWSDLSTAYAMIKPMSGREVFEQQQMQSRVKTKMIIRYQSALKDTADTAAYRVSCDGRIFPIEYVTNLSDDMKNEGKAFQVLYCSENAPEV